MLSTQLSKTIQEIKEIFSAAGIPAAESDFQQLAAYIEQKGDTEIGALFDEMRTRLDPALQKKIIANQHLAAIKAADLEPAKFKAALDSLGRDPMLDKNDVLQIAKAYGVIRIAGKSKASYVESIDKHFYWMLYNRDADAMAKRATPW